MLTAPRAHQGPSQFPINAGKTQLPSSRTRVFYGWWVVAIAALGLFFSEPTIGVYSYSVFLKAVSLDFHVGRGAVAFAFTLHNLCTASLTPLVGYMIDRFGAVIDLFMLVLTGGLERTVDEYRDLLARAGFRLSRVVPTGTDFILLESLPV